MHTLTYASCKCYLHTHTHDHTPNMYFCLRRILNKKLLIKLYILLSYVSIHYRKEFAADDRNATHSHHTVFAYTGLDIPKSIQTLIFSSMYFSSCSLRARYVHSLVHTILVPKTRELSTNTRIKLVKEWRRNGREERGRWGTKIENPTLSLAFYMCTCRQMCLLTKHTRIFTSLAFPNRPSSSFVRHSALTVTRESSWWCWEELRRRLAELSPK